ncbi:MAG TPA: hypothetical protein VGO96_12750 [Pyrinomonadaceae bacterium]|jgi:hypothetical protein|nr:hypothetical protein [Pyrinomonadaceae bacterium]
MKKNFQHIAFALVALCTLLNASALAGGKGKQRVTFNTDVLVGDTLVKKGSYEVTFDEQTSVLTIKRGNEVVAKTSARLEEAKAKSSFVYRTWKNEKEDEVLSSVKFGGGSAVIGKDNAATSSAPAASGSNQQ